MKLTQAQFDRLAQLSRLEFSPAERKRVQKELEKMLSFMEKLQEVDTHGIPPLTNLTDSSCPLREDSPELKIDQKKALKNAPQTDGEYFIVPKMIQK